MSKVTISGLPATKSPRRDAISIAVRKALEESPLDAQADGSRSRAIADRLLRFTEVLVEAGSAEAFLSTNERLMEGFGKEVRKDDRDRLFVELLTATWLGLYFLGIPVADLWDRVRRWEEEDGGGLPNGICVAKAIGDIVRESRKAQQDGLATACADGQQLHVHSFLPMLMFPDLIETGVVHKDHATRSSLLKQEVHALGRHYEFLQLHLYVQAGYPMLYSVPLTLFRSGIDHYGTDLESRKSRWDTMWTHLRKSVFPNGDARHFIERKQRVVLAEPSMPPACFLNHDSGMLTFEGMDAMDGARDIPLPAGYMRSARLGLYRERLIKFETEAPLLNLLSYDNGEDAFEMLYNPDGSERNPSVSTLPSVPRIAD
ncbi:hypothetical protein [Paraburkholderia sp. GAS206C]|uniref:hypothetical protein n=1 Tax=unclassified Paraburkholderia TaxID=2615204 RepID=UPI003D1AD849